MNRIIICLSVCFCLTSCLTRSDSNVNLPLAVGDTGDILVIMPDHLWKSAYGDSIRQYFTEPVWGLPAPEPMFALTQKNSLSKFMQKFRNIIIVNIESGLEQSNFRIKNNVYANNQIIFNVDAPSADSIISAIYRNKDVISTHVLIKGMDAIIADYIKIVDKSIVEKLKEKFMVDIFIPRPYKLDVEKDNFVWIAREQNERIWGILMWEEPYLRKSQLETDSLIFSMNAMTRKHVQGSVEGSYMADEPAIPPEVKRFEKNGVYSVQMNGLWQMENGFMGGPYVNHTIIDIKRGRLITGLGFVFYPNRDKLQMVRQLEAILYTMMPTAD